MDDFVAILTIIIGNGALITAVTLFLNYHTSKSETRLQARKEAHEFYLTLYSNIAYLEELMSAYGMSKSNGKANVFIRDHGLIELSPNEIAANFKKAYGDFLSYYNEKKCSGYEIFLSKRLRKLLFEFQTLFLFDIARGGAINLENMESQREYAHHIVLEIREQMEKAFGLK